MIEWLLHLGAKVAGYSNGIPTSPCHYELLDLNERIQNFDGDIRDDKRLSEAIREFKPEIVFHLAAQPLVRQSLSEPKLTIETNAVGTLNILEAVRTEPSVRACVLITSDKCYQNRDWDFGYREGDTLGGRDPYSASKACAELIFHSYLNSFFQDPKSAKLASARAGNVIGGGDWAKDRVVPDCIRAWSAGEISGIRNPQHTRPWQHVLEPVGGYLWLGTKLFNGEESACGEAFNFGPSYNTLRSVQALVEQMQKNWDAARWEISNQDDSKLEARHLQLNCDKALQRLGWMPTLTFDEAVELTSNWYQTYHTNPKRIRETTYAQLQNYAKLGLERKKVWASSPETNEKSR